MSRFLLLLIFVVWVTCPENQPCPMSALKGLACFGAGYGLLVIFMAGWGHWVARHVHRGDAQRKIRRFHMVMAAARWMVPVWFAVGVYWLGWKTSLSQALSQYAPAILVHMDLPALVMGSLPAFLAWMALWWAQYPADHALRERNTLFFLTDSSPVHDAPSFWIYFGINLRLQLLFTIIPVLALTLMRDVLAVAVPPALHRLFGIEINPQTLEMAISLPTFAFILLFGPVLLRYVLHTQRMPDGALRRRLENICRRHRVGYREVLLWRTHNHVGNAAVMGFIPPLRYILLTDLLLERMTDEQIEAVFAHELGHVFHRHMFWLVASIATVLLIMAGPGQWIATNISTWHGKPWMSDTAQLILVLAMGVGLFAMIFGYLSRMIERQADVFAARALDLSRNTGTSPLPEVVADGPSPISIGDSVEAEQAVRIAPVSRQDAASATVGPYGADLFGSALSTVAIVNNIPQDARSWCHGSIQSRINFLKHLSTNPGLTHRFDREMRLTFSAVALTVISLTGWLIVSGMSAPPTPPTGTAAAVGSP